MATVQEEMKCWFLYDATKPEAIENRLIAALKKV